MIVRSADDISTLLNNPTYAFGIVLEPQEEIADWVKAFNFVVPEKFWLLPLSMQLEIYQTFFEWLEENNHIRNASEAPTIVPIVDWLHTQKVISKVNRMKQLNDAVLHKAELVYTFVQSVVGANIEMD